MNTAQAQTMTTAPRPTAEHIDIIVLGGGLSGLCVARLLHQAGRSVRILEAHQQPGGRIRSVFKTGTDQWRGDLGPTWVWPGSQPIIQGWLDRLKLSTFAQYDEGAGLIDQGSGMPVQRHHLPAQDGIRRLSGGPQEFLNRMQQLLPATTLTTSAPVTHITDSGSTIEVVYGLPGQQRRLRCRQLICTAPARIAAEKISWLPSLPDPLADAMRDTPTWMARQAKVVIRYREPFWRTRGLSGRIFSQTGPIGEAHDHCDPDASHPALFGFLNWPHDLRVQQAQGLETAIRSQLVRCFGKDSPAPVSVHLQDWAHEAYITAARDLTEAPAHPDFRPDIMRQPWADGKLWLAGAETARVSPGLLEGALASAESVAGAILERS